MAYPKREVLIRFTIESPNYDGRFAARTKSGGIYWDANPRDFEENTAEAYTQTFGALMKRNGELERQNSVLENEVENLKNQLSDFEVLRDAWKRVMG